MSYNNAKVRVRTSHPFRCGNESFLMNFFLFFFYYEIFQSCGKCLDGRLSVLLISKIFTIVFKQGMLQ